MIWWRTPRGSQNNRNCGRSAGCRATVQGRSPRESHFPTRRPAMSPRIPSPRSITVLVAAAAVALAVGSGAAFADDIQVKLGGDQEVPPVKTSASGSGTITIKDDKSVSGSVTTSGVMGTMAHIHEGAAGKNGPVIIPLTKSGDSGWAVPAGAKLSDEQYKAYKAGDLYVNVHSDQHGDERLGRAEATHPRGAVWL